MMRAMQRLWSVVLILIGSAFVAPGQSRPDVAKQFIGTWRLVSTMQHFAGGVVKPDRQVGPSPLGYMIYADTNHMCAIFMNPDRPKWEFIAEPKEAELRSAMDGMGAYCGTYEVHVDEGYVLHHVELDRIPNNMGITRKRFFKLNGNRLVLTPEVVGPPTDVVETTITWERVEK
jgi:hypothetical protein